MHGVRSASLPGPTSSMVRRCAQTISRHGQMQARLNAFWSTRRDNPTPTALNIRNQAELRVWMEVMQELLPPAPADVVDLGTGQGSLALVFAALGHRSRGFDLAE